jgi:hypothetical protein
LLLTEQLAFSFVSVEETRRIEKPAVAYFLQNED